MTITPREALIELGYREILPLEDAGGTRIDCLRGRMWITESGNDDIVLEAGESHEVSRDGRTVVQALHGGVVAVRVPPSMTSASRLAAWIAGLLALPAAAGTDGHAPVPVRAATGSRRMPPLAV